MCYLNLKLVSSILVFFIFVILSLAQKVPDKIIFRDDTNYEIGGICVRKKNGKQGICTYVHQCNPNNYIEKKNRTLESDICFFHNSTPIVCCAIQDLDIGGQIPINRAAIGRKIYDKCNEYTRNYEERRVQRQVNLWPEIKYEPTVVGGIETEVGEFPHMASLGQTLPDGSIDWKCGGTLISKNFILTAAHCVNSPNELPNRIRLGEQNLRSSNDGAAPQDFEIAQIIKHPDYYSLSMYNDIALIKLAREARFSTNLRPACLWQQHRINDNKAVAIGWGHTSFGGRQSDELLKIQLNLFENKECSDYYPPSPSMQRSIIESQVCAGDLTGQKDTCQGDSGGPLSIVHSVDGNSVKQHYIIGITSFGKHCATSNPSVYTRVSSYLAWIESIVWP